MPESNSAVVILTSVKFDWCLTVAPHYFFSTKILSEGPYLKSFIRRVLCSHRERFCSSRASVIRLRVEPFFLAALHRAVGTKTVNSGDFIKTHHIMGKHNTKEHTFNTSLRPLVLLPRNHQCCRRYQCVCTNYIVYWQHWWSVATSI